MSAWWQDPVQRRAGQRFEHIYAERSNVMPNRLHSNGRYAEPCDCDEEICTGWAMGHQWEDALIDGPRVP